MGFLSGDDELKGLRDLYVEQLRDLYSSEKQILDALPKMEEKASTQALKSAFREHLRQTEEHKNRLERIFRELEEKPSGHTCKAMKGIIKEGSEMLEKKGDLASIDAGLIASAQRVEHYEMAGYGTARSLANRLGQNSAAELLQSTLEEEKETDRKLTELAEQDVNPRAEGMRTT